jgi:5-methylcytosine-specific restriction endonuclease McrA
MPSVYVKKYPNGRRTTVTCQICAKSFETFNRSIRRGTAKFCSRACKADSQKRPMAILACFTCGKSFERWPGQAAKARSNQAYCSWNCRTQGISGSDNPNWRNSPHSRGSDWEGNRLTALERDNFRCTECGSADRVLVHHVIEWEVTHDNDLGNLRTLCMGCHTRTHNMRRAEQAKTAGIPYNKQTTRQTLPCA